MGKKIAYLLKSYGFDSKACGGEGAEVQYFTLFYTDFSTLDVSDYLAVALMKFGNVPVTIHHSSKLLSEGIILTNETRSKIDEYRTHYSSKKVIPTEDCLKYLWN